MPRHRQTAAGNLLLLIAALTILAASAEIYLRLNPPAVVYMRVRRIVQHTHSQASPNPYMDYIPAASLSKRFKNYEFDTLIKTNSFSMRDREYEIEKPSGIKRIAVMGDSFIFGWGVENEEIFTEILESRLQNTQVFNFGVSGYAAYQELERLKDEGLRFSPDVVLFFCQSFPDGYPQLEPQAKSHGVPVPGERQAHSFKQSYLYMFLQEARPVVSEKIRLFMRPVKEPASFDNSERIQHGLDVLERLKKLSEEKQFIPVVIYIPPKQAAREGDDAEARTLHDFCKIRKMQFLDLTAALHGSWKKAGKPPYFRIDDHWNREGHRVAAAAIEDFLLAEKIL